MIPTTLCFLIKENEILLAMKKRGFGIGKWNGVGGKIENGESIEDAVIREAKEEIGVEIDKNDLESFGSIKFFFNNNEEWDTHMNIYCAKNWKGEPVESEEMKPCWFKYDEIPFKDMWVDDKHWLPKILSGKNIESEFYFNKEGSEIKNFVIREI